MCGWKLHKVRIAHTVTQLSMYLESKNSATIVEQQPGGGLFIENLSDMRGSL